MALNIPRIKSIFNSSGIEGIEKTQNEEILLTIPGVAFMPGLDTDTIIRDPDEGVMEANANGISFVGPILLPQGATVIKAEVEGNISDETWFLRRMDFNNIGFATSMATAVFNTADTSIATPVIDNEKFTYWFSTSSLDTGNQINGGKVTYTI